MKTIISLCLTLFVAFSVAAQNNLPTTQIKNLKDGKKLGFNEAIEPGKVTVVSFWATWCVPCKREIKNVQKKMTAWKSEADFNYVTISQDDFRLENQARSYATTQGWDFPHYIDPNGDLKRSLNFQTVPFTLIIDQEGKVAFMHSGYTEGGEDEVFAKVKELQGSAPKQ